MATDLNTALIATLNRAESVIERLESLLPSEQPATDWNAIAWRWQQGQLKAVRAPHQVALGDLQHVDRQKQLLVQNTEQFLAGLPANNALLWGSRGTGKSSLIKALLTQYSDQGLRLIEVETHALGDLPEIIESVAEREEKFILFADDLSFGENDPGYTALKAILDGSVAAAPNNLLIYATSNRRHLVPEYNEENLQAQHINGEIHHGDVVEEKISLSERFGLWLSFHPFKQAQYLTIVRHYLKDFGVDVPKESWEKDALRHALSRGSRSGRVAQQFAKHYAGAISLGS